MQGRKHGEIRDSVKHDHQRRLDDHEPEEQRRHTRRSAPHASGKEGDRGQDQQQQAQKHQQQTGEPVRGEGVFAPNFLPEGPYPREEELHQHDGEDDPG